MFQKSGPTLPLSVVLFAAIILHGCAGGPLSRIGEAELPSELPKELQDKFEVKEINPEAAASPTPAAANASKKKELRKKAKKTKPAEPAPVPIAGLPPAAPVAPVAPIAGASPAPEEPFSYPSRRPKKEAIWIGEKQVYGLSYFGVEAGDFTLEILPFKTVGDRKVYHARGKAVSSSVFSMFYRVNDMVETYVDFDGIFSHRFHIELDETKQTRNSLELNDSEKGQSFYWNRWNRKAKGYIEIKEFKEIPRFPQDSLSALYFLRTQPLPPGAVLTFPVVSEGKWWEAVITVLRREILDTPMGKIPTVVLRPDTKYQGILQKKGESFIWLSDDDRRVLVRLEAKVRIGTVVAQLKKMEPGTEPAPGNSAP